MIDPYRAPVAREPPRWPRPFRLLAPHDHCPRCKSTRWVWPGPVGDGGDPTPRASDDRVRLSHHVRRCSGRRRGFWGLLGRAVCPLWRPHGHGSCQACGAEWLEATPEDPEPGEAV